MIDIYKKQILGGLMIYFIIRFFSYFFSPGTPLYLANPVNWLISTGILGATVYFLIKKDPPDHTGIRTSHLGWLIITAELILGGAGSFLEIYGIALRTVLLVFAMGIFLYHVIIEKNWRVLFENKPIFYILSAIYIAVGIATVRGFYLGNNPRLILADAIPYLFLLYYFPLKQLLSFEGFRRVTFSMLIASAIGSFVFTYFTLAGFSSHLFVLQDSYYHWFRDVASGKITDYGTGFFRIITNEQLLLIPLFLYLFAKQIANKHLAHSRLLQIASVLLLAILTINLTRIYFLGLAIGILFLFSIKNWKRWLTHSVAALFIFLVIFILTHLAVTKGKSLGLEYLGLRLQSITMPQSEDSSLSRLLLLPKVLNKIKDRPIFGNGLGDTVDVYSPVFKESITTQHFDWGYLEIMAEMGIIGLAAWLSLIGYTLYHIKKYHNFFAPLIALLFINITSPALFHVMGIVFLITFLANTKPAIEAGHLNLSSLFSLTNRPRHYL